ncbi:hypothetical protein M3Y98_00824400 [Aphelenchoides besseyi]|nr:hypothetical protein M3Y98_00824400 [Aphelenchoides besseyi]
MYNFIRAVVIYITICIHPPVELVLSTYQQFGQSSDSQTSSDVFESELTAQKLSHSSFADSTETNVEDRSDNSLVAPPPSFVSGVQSIQQLPSMTLNMTPELHSPTPLTPSDISSESESTVDRPQPCSQFPSHYKWSQSEQIDELAERFLELIVHSMSSNSFCKVRFDSSTVC